MDPEQDEMQSVTVTLPKALVEEAMKASGQGLAPTIREGLQSVIAREAFEKLMQRRGDMKFSIDVDELRED